MDTCYTHAVEINNTHDYRFVGGYSNGFFIKNTLNGWVRLNKCELITTCNKGKGNDFIYGVIDELKMLTYSTNFNMELIV